MSTRENRLARELSPYLRQHAHNPVDWYAWGDEALEKARSEDRPILLSIGYSACHWCHVMERESFDDAQIAALMNEHFVSIKVDREERPDLDQIYQLVVQLMRRSGGWPLTVFLTPKLAPFFGGTYFPPTERYGMPSFRTVLTAVADAYASRRDDVEKTAGELTSAIAQVTSVQADPEEPPADAVGRAAKALARRFDDRHGGFGDAPKFPNTMSLDVMLRAYAHGDAPSLERVKKALDAMREGGIYDQLGGGFHRYSTDERWLVPHFEKMLYDNALLARLYLDGWRATGEEQYAQTVRETLSYVEREMLSPDGLFYSTQDADSEGEEGKFFVWTPAELADVLSDEETRIAAVTFGVTEGGNFEHSGATVLHINRSARAVATQLGESEENVRAILESARQKLFAARETRIKPFRDEKIIATWNGLMIGVFASAGAAMGEPRWIEVAEGALSAIERTLWRDGALLRIAKDGQARINGFLEDYADVASAAIDVHEATLGPSALRFARALIDAAIALFWDEKDEGFFFAPAGATDLLVRTKDAYDNAVPSGTSSIAHALLRIAAYTGDASYAERAERTLHRMAGPALSNPFAFGHLLGAIDRAANGPVELVVVAEKSDSSADELLRAARRAYVPNLVLARVEPNTAAEGIASGVERRQKDGRATAYVCRARTCSAPVTDAGELTALLTVAESVRTL